MRILIKKNINKEANIDKQKCLATLSDFGLEITDSEKLCFTENHIFTTNIGKNKLKVFYSVLRGQVQIDNKNSILRWYLNIDEIIFKAVLTLVIIMPGVEFLILDDWISSFITGIIIGTIIFVSNKLSLDSQIRTLTEKMSNKDSI